MGYLNVLQKSIENNVITLSASNTWQPYDISDSDSVLEFRIANAIYKPEMFNEDIRLTIHEYSIENGTIECSDDFSTEQYDIKGKITLTTRWFNKVEILKIIKEIERRLTQQSKRAARLQNIISEASHLVEESIRRTEMKLNADKSVNAIKLLTQIRESLNTSKTKS